MGFNSGFKGLKITLYSSVITILVYNDREYSLSFSYKGIRLYHVMINY